jgi:chromobox protein 1
MDSIETQEILYEKPVSSPKRNEIEEMDEEVPIYIVEVIRDQKMVKGKFYYQVKWEGFPEEQNTWEPVEHLAEVPHLIEEFKRKRATQRPEVFKKPAPKPEKRNPNTCKTKQVTVSEKIPNSILHVYEDKLTKDLLFEVSYEPRKNVGYRNEIITREELKRKAPFVLLEYYESKVIIDKPKRKSRRTVGIFDNDDDELMTMEECAKQVQVMFDELKKEGYDLSYFESPKPKNTGNIIS